MRGRHWRHTLHTLFGYQLVTRLGVSHIQPVDSAPNPLPQASFDYAATEPGELTFTKGDYITVIEEDPSGWWQGRNERTGQTGVFPSNYTAPA